MKKKNQDQLSIQSVFVSSQISSVKRANKKSKKESVEIQPGGSDGTDLSFRFEIQIFMQIL